MVKEKDYCSGCYGNVEVGRKDISSICSDCELRMYEAIMEIKRAVESADLIIRKNDGCRYC